MAGNPEAYVALGIDLRLTKTEEGGRRTPIGPITRDSQYRPNWGFDALAPAYAQAGAPVFSLERPTVKPGERVRAVIVPMYPEYWTAVIVGTQLKMFEGFRVCGHATVVWRAPITWPVGDDDQTRFDRWTQTGD